MISAIGNLLLAAVATAALLALVAFGFRGGDRFGDAQVRVRAVRMPWAGPGGQQGAVCTDFHADIRIDNQNDSPALVSTRDAAGGLHPFGMVDGREEQRFLIPLRVTHGVGRLTVVVQHNAERPRVHRVRLRPAGHHSVSSSTVSPGSTTTRMSSSS